MHAPTEFTPLASAIGGVLIGISSALVLLGHGRIAGISGIVSGIVSTDARERAWKLAFLAGLLGGGAALAMFAPQVYGAGAPSSLPILAIAGVLVGIGTRLGSGCTSGHGVCGTARLSGRSLVSTVVFMGVAIGVVWLTRLGVG